VAGCAMPSVTAARPTCAASGLARCTCSAEYIQHTTSVCPVRGPWCVARCCALRCCAMPAPGRGLLSYIASLRSAKLCGATHRMLPLSLVLRPTLRVALHCMQRCRGMRRLAPRAAQICGLRAMPSRHRPVGPREQDRTLTRPWYLKPPRSKHTVSMPFARQTSAIFFPTTPAASCSQHQWRCLSRMHQQSASTRASAHAASWVLLSLSQIKPRCSDLPMWASGLCTKLFALLLGHDHDVHRACGGRSRLTHSTCCPAFATGGADRLVVGWIRNGLTALAVLS
jgi:hypothetical protein